MKIRDGFTGSSVSDILGPDRKEPARMKAIRVSEVP